MDELKTLKDLSQWKIWDKSIEDYGRGVMYNELRREAIKWARHLYQKAEDEDRPADGEAFATAEWIKSFFNITDEELK